MPAYCPPDYVSRYTIHRYAFHSRFYCGNSGGTLIGTAAATDRVDNGDIDDEYGEVDVGTYIETPSSTVGRVTRSTGGRRTSMRSPRITTLSPTTSGATGSPGKTDDGHTLSGYTDDLDFFMESLNLANVRLSAGRWVPRSSGPI